MSVPHFLGLPCEIRDIIYSYALPTGLIYISTPLPREVKGSKSYRFRHRLNPYANSVEVDLRLLQTCKLIFNEAIDLFFRTTTVEVTPGTADFFMDCFPGTARRIQHLRLEAYITSAFRVEFEEHLEKVYRWIGLGALKTVSLKMVRPQPAPLRSYPYLSSNQLPNALSAMVNPSWKEIWEAQKRPGLTYALYEELLEQLRRSFAKEGWSRVERRLVLTLYPWDFEKNLSSGYWNYQMLRELHKAFGGELWMCNRLGDQNGRELLPLFETTSEKWSFERRQEAR